MKSIRPPSSYLGKLRSPLGPLRVVEVDLRPSASQTFLMAHTYMLFDFGTDEEKAQQARHKLEGWKQAFRLDKKLQVKFDRGEDLGAEATEAEEPPKKAEKPKSKSKSKAKDLRSRGRQKRVREACRTPLFLRSRKTVRAAMARPHPGRRFVQGSSPEARPRGRTGVS